MKTSFAVMCYNQEAYVAEAVRAALAQEGPPLEIILSDDCSKDASFQIMQDLAKNYRGPHRVTVRRNETNLGLIGHFQHVFSLCSGEVMIVAWADDVSMPDRALRVCEAFEASDALLVHSHATCVDLDGNEIPPTYVHADLVKGETDISVLAQSHCLFLGATGAYHRKLLQKYGKMANPATYEDLVYGFRAALEGRVRFIDRPLIRYRVGSGVSTSHRLADKAGKRIDFIRHLKIFRTAYAQRRRDALTFGRSRGDPIQTSIQRSRLFVLFQLYFFGEINGARVFKLMARHPVIAVRALQKVLRQERRFGSFALQQPGGAAKSR